jgi:hypothetical protein
MLLDLINPVKTLSILKMHNKRHLYVFMFAPFAEPFFYGHFSIIFFLVGLWSYFIVANCVILHTEQDWEAWED